MENQGRLEKAAMNIAAITRFKHGDLLETLQRLNWSQSELARRTGIKATRISEYATLKSRPCLNHMQRIQAAFGEAGVFLDVEKAWPDNFHGTRKSLEIIQTREVDPDKLIGLTPEVLQLPAPNALEDLEQREIIASAIENIPSTEHKRKILRMYFLEGMTPSECAEKTGSTPTYCSMVVRGSLWRIRSWIRNEEFGENFREFKKKQDWEKWLRTPKKFLHFPEPVEAQP